MTKKLPYMELYTGDWLKDPQLSMCSSSTRGIWIDLLCAMHESNRCGKLSGTTDQLARLCRCTTSEFVLAIAEIDSTETATVTKRNDVVTVICRRMKRQHDERVKTAARVKKHRCNATETDDVRQCNNTPSPSSSSSVSYKDLKTSGLHPRSGRGLWIDELELKDTGKVLAWLEKHAKKLGLDPGNFDNQARVMGAAVRALEAGESPGGVFVVLVRQKLWENVTDAQAAEGKRLVAAHHAAGSNGFAQALAGALRTVD